VWVLVADGWLRPIGVESRVTAIDIDVSSVVLHSTATRP